jgi:D-cysteine desulfhydrase
MARRRGGRARQAARPVSRRLFVKAGIGVAGTLALTGGTAHYGALQLNDIGEFAADRLTELRAGRTTRLFELFGGLERSVPWRPIGRRDTPVEAMSAVAGAGDVRLLVKRDDLTSDLYGGNKVRKLEHLLAEAALRERRTLITVGGAGTNHGLATALHGRALGFDVRLALFNQPVTPFVQRNLRGFVHAGADVHYGGGELGAFYRARRLYQASEAAGAAPYFIMLGGSSRLGTIGYVNAALELAAQVRAGALPEPDRLFIALGSGGTAAGLVAGCRLAGLRTRVVAVRASVPALAHAFTVRYLANDVLRWLQHADAAVPRVRVGYDDFDVVTDQLGRGYGHPTAAGEAAAEWIGSRLLLEPTYTAKALAACLDHCRSRARPGEVVLYWHSANAAPIHEADSADPLPGPLRAMLTA